MPKQPRRKLRSRRARSLRGVSKRELARLKAEYSAALDRRWRAANPRGNRSRGRPNTQDVVYAACARIQKRLLKRHATLSEWYRAVENDLKRRSNTLSRPTKTTFVRQWLKSHLPIDTLPDGLGPYLINTQREFSTVLWVILWGSLCRKFPDVQVWLSNYKLQHGMVAGALPHDILPTQLQAKLKTYFDAPLGPRLYEDLVRKTLRKATEK